MCCEQQESAVPVLSDEQLLQWLKDNLEWDGQRYWLPELVVREREYGQEFCPEPTLDEFRALLSQHIQENPKRNLR